MNAVRCGGRSDGWRVDVCALFPPALRFPARLGCCRPRPCTPIGPLRLDPRVSVEQNKLRLLISAFVFLSTSSLISVAETWHRCKWKKLRKHKAEFLMSLRVLHEHFKSHNNTFRETNSVLLSMLCKNIPNPNYPWFTSFFFNHTIFFFRCMQIVSIYMFV